MALNYNIVHHTGTILLSILLEIWLSLCYNIYVLWPSWLVIIHTKNYIFVFNTKSNKNLCSSKYLLTSAWFWDVVWHILVPYYNRFLLLLLQAWWSYATMPGRSWPRWPCLVRTCFIIPDSLMAILHVFINLQFRRLS